MTDIQKIRIFLTERLLNNEKLLHFDDEKKQVLDLLIRTVNFGESNSMLIIGPAGAGKTKLVNSVVSELNSQGCFKDDSMLVKLNGLIHTNDKLALKSITFQMNLDNAVDGKVFGSFAENLAFLLACLKQGKKQQSKSAIFVLEDFDLFCSHHNQTLLYNLFDISQSAQTPICVLGVTCRLDVIQLLEKRVKSRFSHRQMFIYPGPGENNELNDLEYAIIYIKWMLELPVKCGKITENSRKQWNKQLDNLISDKKFRNVIERLIDLELNKNVIKNILFKCLRSLSHDSPLLTSKIFETELDLIERNDIVLVLQDLSALELCLIISMKHHCEIYDNQAMNFEMVYGRYLKFTNKHSSIQNVPRAVVMKAFEHIENLELISMITQGNPRTQREYQFFKLLVTSQQISEAIGKYAGLPTEIIQWFNSSLA